MSLLSRLRLFKWVIRDAFIFLFFPHSRTAWDEVVDNQRRMRQVYEERKYSYEKE